MRNPNRATVKRRREGRWTEEQVKPPSSAPRELQSFVSSPCRHAFASPYCNALQLPLPGMLQDTQQGHVIYTP